MLLLIGADAEIGAATFRHMAGLGLDVAGTTRRPDRAAPRRPRLDLAEPLDAWEPPAGTTAACIFAAVARLAACAQDPAATAKINVEQTIALVDRLTARGIHVLFLSSNQVFDGSVPAVAADAPLSPVSEYGRQKARTETAIRARMDAGAPLAILRLAKVVSPDMPLLRGWATALAAGRPIRAFSDMTMAPAPTATVVAAITALLSERATGTFQLTGPTDMTYAEIGRRIAGRLGAVPSLVEPVAAASAGMPVGATPRHTTLDSSLLRRRYGIEVPDAWSILEPIVTQAHGG